MSTIPRQWFVATGRPADMFPGIEGRWIPLASDAEAQQWLAGEAPTLLLRPGVPGDTETMCALCEEWNLDGAETISVARATPMSGDAVIVIDRANGTIEIFEVTTVAPDACHRVPPFSGRHNEGDAAPNEGFGDAAFLMTQGNNVRRGSGEILNCHDLAWARS